MNNVCPQNGKVAHDCRKKAMKQAAALNKRYPDQHWRVYQCGLCGDYHVGREIKMRRKNSVVREVVRV